MGDKMSSSIPLDDVKSLVENESRSDQTFGP